MSTLRFKVVEEAYGRKAVPVAIPSERPSEYYGKYVFNRAQMYKYLDKDTYDALVYAIDNKEPLSRRLADRVAAGMKQWAMDNGARHYSHWFHPLTDGTAEKHDGFIEHDGSRNLLRQVSRTVESATRSRLADIRHGTFLLLLSSLTIHCVSLRFSSHTQESRSTTKHRFCVRSTAWTRLVRR